jgi:two-component system OmpR family response regulator
MPQLESRKPRIFVADDDRNVLDLILTRLTLAGYETGYARDGREALSGMAASRPSGIIPDMNMLRRDGFGVLERLRKAAPASRTPVMVLTARHTPEDVQRALAMGARDYMAKPFQDAQLLALVARLIRPKAMVSSADEVFI